MSTRRSILLIDDDPEYRELVMATLGEAEGTFDVKSAPSLASGLEMIDQRAPEAILVDLNLGDSTGYESFLRVQERSQGIPIIVLTGLDDDELAIRAVEDGAQDYLVKSSIQPKVMARCVNMALGRQKQHVSRDGAAAGIPGMVFSFIGTKGGVGTSTTAVNLAALLTQNGFETLVIELQQVCPGTLPLYLQQEPVLGLNSLLEKPVDAITTSDLQRCDAGTVSGLRFLCATASRGTPRMLDADHVHRIVSLARRAFRFVVLDLPAYIDEGVAQALNLSDSITLVADREWSSVRSGAAFLQQIRTATARAKEVQFALVDRSVLESPLPLADVKSELAMHPLAMIPHAAAKITLSQFAKTPLVLLHPDDPFSLAHFQLAEHLLGPAAGAQYSLRSGHGPWGPKSPRIKQQPLAARAGSFGSGAGDPPAGKGLPSINWVA